MIICRGRKRVRQLYMSRKNKLLVHMERDRDGRTPGYFLLKYESEYTTFQQKIKNGDLINIPTTAPFCSPYQSYPWGLFLSDLITHQALTK